MKHSTFFFLSILMLFLFKVENTKAAETCPTATNSSNTQYINSSLTLKILLVEFPGVPHRTSPSAYTKTDFENLLVSSGSYVSPNIYSPDGDLVYGSMRDYFQKMSSGNVTVTGSVVNTVTNNVPNWIVLPHNKSYYYGFHYDQTPIFSDAINAATTAGLNVSWSDNIAIIYAGTTYYYNPAINDFSGLNPMQSGSMYIMGERLPNHGDAIGVEISTARFSRIGIHCHEFAHVLGIGHSSGSRADIMQSGTRNGPNNNGSAPAPLNPIARMLKGWLTPTTISGQQQFDLYYSLTAPQVFRINGNVSGEYFLIENRRFDQNMVIGTTTVPDYNNSEWMPIAHSQNTTNVILSQGVLVWRVKTNFPNDNYDDDGLIYASGRYNKTFPENIATETDAGDPFPGVTGVKVLSPWSDTRDPYSTSLGAPNNIFITNTKSSTNAGMEIISENTNQGYFTVMMYQSNPQNSSPSKPQNIAIQLYQNGDDENPRITWTAAGEPDVTSGGYVVVERRIKSPQIYPYNWSSWSTIATINGSNNSYTDQSITTAGTGTDSVQYRFRFKDSENKYSIYSDIVNIMRSHNLDKRSISEKKPISFSLTQNYPNPFNPSTTIEYAIPAASNVQLTVFDHIGREVAHVVNEHQNAGYYSASFDASKLSSGVYFYRITAGTFSSTKKMLLMK